MSTMIAGPGICYACGFPLVQISASEGEPQRTYHPHAALPEGFTCPALIPLGVNGTVGSDVAHDAFLMRKDELAVRESLARMEKEA